MRLIPCVALLTFCAAVSVQAEPPLEWAVTYDGGGAYLDDAVVALADVQGNVVLAGHSHDGVDGIDVLVCKRARETGQMLWECRVTAFDTNDMAVSDMARDPWGDLLVAGYVVGCEG